MRLREKLRLEELRSQRGGLLRELTSATGVPLPELEQRAAAIQRRVESIVADVEGRRAERQRQRRPRDFSWNEGWRGFGRLIIEELHDKQEHVRFFFLVCRFANTHMHKQYF